MSLIPSVQFCSIHWADISLCTSARIFYPDFWWTGRSWIRKCSLQLLQYFRWQSNNFKKSILWDRSEKKKVPEKEWFRKENCSEENGLQWDDWECKKYMGNGGLTQVAASETVYAGVLVIVDGENAKLKILTWGKTWGTKKVNCKTR